MKFSASDFDLKQEKKKVDRKDMEACQFYNRWVNFIMKGVSMPSEQLAE